MALYTRQFQNFVCSKNMFDIKGYTFINFDELMISQRRITALLFSAYD